MKQEVYLATDLIGLIGRRPLVLHVKLEGKKYGRLEISKGTIAWLPQYTKGKSKRKYSKNWVNFAKAMLAE